MPKEMKIEKTEEFDDDIEFFLVEAAAELDEESVGRMTCGPGFVVTMQINGAEVDPARTIQVMIDQYNDQVETAARRMVENRGYEIVELFHTALAAFEASLDEGIRKMFPEREQEG